MSDSDLQQDQSEFNVLFVHSAIDDYPLSTEEFRVYAHIARRAGLGEAWPSIDNIAKKCRIHPDTARRCIHSLTAYRLLSVEDRSKQGKSNKYRLTKKSLWMTSAEVEALQVAQANLGKAKRDARKKLKDEATPTPQTPSETKGGVVNKGRGSERREASETKGHRGGETKGGGASETKGDEVYPLKLSLEVAPTAVVLSTELNGQPELPAAPVAVLDPPERTTSEDAALRTASVAETADGPVVAGTPNGVTPEGLEISDEDLEMLFERQDENAPAVEQVPGGAAAEPARPAQIDDLVAVPEAELIERPQAVANDPAYKAIMALVGGAAKLELLLGEETRSGGYGRERWLRLNLEEVERVKVTAQAQARQPGPDGKRVPFSTLSILGLDRLIGAPKLTGGGQKAGPSATSYGNTTTVIPSGEKLTSPPKDPLKYVPGSQWREQKSGAVLTLQELVTTKKGMAFLMSNGATMTGLDLTLRFEAV